MRTFIYAILLTLLAQPVWALSNIELYDYCKPLVDNNYAVTGLETAQKHRAFTCVGFHSGLIHHANLMCEFGEDYNVRPAFGTSIKDTNISIQRFLNWIEANVEYWHHEVRPFWLMGTCEEK